jgi:hypothetical protein
MNITKKAVYIVVGLLLVSSIAFALKDEIIEIGGEIIDTPIAIKERNLTIDNGNALIQKGILDVEVTELSCFKGWCYFTIFDNVSRPTEQSKRVLDDKNRLTNRDLTIKQHLQSIANKTSIKQTNETKYGEYEKIIIK